MLASALLPMTRQPPDRVQAEQHCQTALAASFLASGRTLDAWSRMLAVAALIGLWGSGQSASARGWLALSVALAALQAWWAWRVALDARIFARWARAWRQPDTRGVDGVTEDLRRFDRALADWLPGMAPDPASFTGASRSLAARLSGARRLLGRQLLAGIAQALCLAGAVAATWPN